MAFALVLSWWVLRRWVARRPVRTLLGPLATGPAAVTCYLRGLFVPTNEFFSRRPGVGEGGPNQDMDKWAGIPEVHAAGDLRAFADLLRVLFGTNPRLVVACFSQDATRRGWNEDAIAVGPHHRALEILEGCEPNLVTFRHPGTFRTIGSQEVFQAKDGQDYGLVYKGRYPTTRRSCWVVMGTGDTGTEAAAHFLRVHARPLGQLMGAGPFAAIVAVSSPPGREPATLQWLAPRPRWWRRLLHRRRWRAISAGFRRVP